MSIRIILLTLTVLSLSGCVKTWIESSGHTLIDPTNTRLSLQAPNRIITGSPVFGAESKERIEVTNICALLNNYPTWYKHALASEKRWGVPVSVQFAIMNQESRFDGNAKPPHPKTGLFKRKKPSSAFGYAQAKTGTWKDYTSATKQPYARRDRFRDAADFIGWYNNRTHSLTGVKKSDTYRLYIAYHEGVGGYTRKSYHKKPWLIKVANKVAKNSWQYQTQLQNCHHKLLQTASK